MADPDLVSVVVPTYNRGFCVEEALDSVYGQSYRPIELVVIDDGSEDNTMETVLEWKRQHQNGRFKVEVNRQKNGGAPSARNAGINLASGSYIQFLDSDDVMLGEKTATQLHGIKSRNVDYVWSWWSVSVEGERSVRRVRGAGVPSSVAVGLFRRSAVDKVGPWNEKLPFAQDWNYITRLLSTDCEIGHVDEHLYLVKVRDAGSITSARNSDPESYKLNLLVMDETVRQIERVSGPSARLICARSLMTMRQSAAKSDPLTFGLARDMYLRYSRRAGSNWAKGVVVRHVGGALYRAWSRPGRR